MISNFELLNRFETVLVPSASRNPTEIDRS
jgi:hypothetical protein